MELGAGIALGLILAIIALGMVVHWVIERMMRGGG
jgi:flagellar biogenesis protein FliO